MCCRFSIRGTCRQSARKKHFKRGSLARKRLDGKFSTVRADGSMRDRQAEAASAITLGEKGIENPGKVFRGHPRTVVDNSDPNWMIQRVSGQAPGGERVSH